MSTPEYDLHNLAEPYRKSKDLPVRVYSEIPNHMALLEPLAGRDVLDLACGEGFYTRLIKQAGARRVVGVDLAKSMIDMARRQEAAAPLGIEYVLAQAECMPDLGKFDVVSAAFLLCNAPDRATLRGMLSAAATRLEPGGRFVTTDARFGEHPGADYRPYGMSTSLRIAPVDGAPYEITFSLDDASSFTITNYAHSRAAYEAAFAAAGFVDVTWHAPTVTEAGLARFGDAFWKTYVEHPPIVCITARRA